MRQVRLFEQALPPPSCVISECGRYRYALQIPLSAAPRVVMFVLANPSTAVVVNGVLVPDPTIARCMGYAIAWGYGTLIVGNVRSWRATDPSQVPADPLAIGPDNDWWLSALALHASLLVMGYGKLGGERGLEVLRLLRQDGHVPHALKLNNDGSPAHPLYLASSLKPFPMEIAA